jgi:Protein of unknown function (DUF2723)
MRGPRFGRALLGAIVLLAAVGYTLTAPHWILGGDNGEFSALYAAGGIAHPPGYPSMVLWLRLWHWLPVDTPAHGAALATVILGVASVWTVQRACLAWGASTAATAFASAVYAFSPLTWKLCSHAEVFAMNAMFAGAILALSAPEPRLRGEKLTLALGLVAGVAIANHQSITFLAPIGLLAAVRGVREARRPWVAALAGVLALFLGLVPPYLYVYAVARTGDPRTSPMWIEAPTLAGVLFHFRRGAYGSLTLSTSPAQRHVVGNLVLFAKSSARQMLGTPVVVLAAAGFALATRRAAAVPARRLRSLIALGAAFVLTGPLFIAWFNLPLDHAGPTVAERFYLQPEVILTVMGALSLDALVPWLMAREGLMAALTAQAALAASILSVPEVLEHNRPTVALYIENTLRGAPENAILVGTGDHRWGGFMYARYALHMRPDVTYIVPGTLTQAWYRRDMQAMTGVSFETPAHGPVGPKTLMARLLASRRPLFYTDWPEPEVAGTPHYSVGTLMRVLREGESAPAPEELEAMNLEAFSKYELEPTPPEDVNGWGYALQGDYARAWGELGEAYAKEGNVAKQQECFALAARFAPWLVRVE